VIIVLVLSKFMGFGPLPMDRLDLAAWKYAVAVASLGLRNRKARAGKRAPQTQDPTKARFVAHRLALDLDRPKVFRAGPGGLRWSHDVFRFAREVGRQTNLSLSASPRSALASRGGHPRHVGFASAV